MSAEEELMKGIAAWEAEQYKEAETWFRAADEHGSMKAGRYLAVLALRRAAERGDITSKVILGTLYELGYAVSCDTNLAAELYNSALKDDHKNKEGFMLAAGADLGLGRIYALAGNEGKAVRHLSRALEGGEKQIQGVSDIWLKHLER